MMDLDDAIQAKQEIAIVHAALRQLPARTERAIRLRYGIGCDEHTLDECGPKLGGVTRERVRQIVAKGERKLQWKMRTLWPVKWREARDAERKLERERKAEWAAQEARDLALRQLEYEAEKAQRAIDMARHAEERKARLAEWEANNVIAMAKERAIREAMRAEEQRRWQAGAAKRAEAAAKLAAKRARYVIAMEIANERFNKARLAYVAMIKHPDKYDEAVYLEFEAAQDAHYKTCCYYDDGMDSLNEEQRYG